MNNYLRIYLFIILLVVPQLAFAQLPILEIVDEPEKIGGELISRRDINGRICAAVQIVTNLKGLKYESYNGIVGEVEHLPGRDMVYISPDERVLEIFAIGYQPFKLVLSGYGIHLAPKLVWQISLSGTKPQLEYQVIILTEPGAEVTIDDVNMGFNRQFPLLEGSHKLRLNLSGYQSMIETIYVDENMFCMRLSSICTFSFYVFSGEVWFKFFKD